MSLTSNEILTLDSRSVALVRIAALAAIQAPPAAYPVCLGHVGDLDIYDVELEGVLDAIEPIIGGARLARAREAVGLALARAPRERSVPAMTLRNGGHDG